MLAHRHSIGKGRERRAVDRDLARVASRDELAEPLPLVRLRLRIPRGIEQAAEAVATDGKPLDRLSGARIEKDEDGRPARAHAFRVQHRRHHRIFEIFPRDQHPHVDPVGPHEGRDERIEALLQPCILHARPLLQGKEAGHERFLRLCEIACRRSRADGAGRSPRHKPRRNAERDLRFPPPILHDHPPPQSPNTLLLAQAPATASHIAPRGAIVGLAGRLC